MFFPFAISYIIFLMIQKNGKKKFFLFQSFCIIALSLGLSAMFWLPAVFEKKYTVGLEVFDYARNFPEIYQLLVPSWGTGFSGGSLFGRRSSLEALLLLHNETPLSHSLHLEDYTLNIRSNS